MRPSKQFFFRLIANRMRGRNYGTVLDVASAAFRNVALFPADQYVGVDLDLSLVTTGTEAVPGSIGVCCDIRALTDIIPERSVDLVVSTHTLSYVPRIDLVSALQQLINVNSPGGDLLFNLARSNPHFHEMVRLAERSYGAVVTVAYRNRISVAFERANETTNGKYRPGTLSKLVERSKILVAFESLTSRLGFGDHGLVIFSVRVGRDAQTFQITGAIKVSDRVFARRSRFSCTTPSGVKVASVPRPRTTSQRSV